MSEDRKGFTVKDRRHFTAEGEVRSATVEEEARPAPAPAPALAPAPEPAPQRTLPHAEPEVDFASFLLSLAAQAGSLLEEGGEAPLAGARQIIGVLEMLRGKTQGHRTADEDRVLDGLLYELKMAYVQRAKA